jgi:hypothetical protein
MYLIDGEYADKKLSASELREKYKNAEKIDIEKFLPEKRETFREFTAKKNLENLTW